MSAQDVWRAAHGSSKQKSVQIMWPELAAALDGHAGTPDAPPAPTRIPCACCRGARRWERARWRVGPTGTPMCTHCAARDAHRSLRPFVRIP